METIKHTKRNQAFKLSIGVIFIIFGLTILIQAFVGIFFIIIGLIAFTFSSGIDIDYANNKIRSYWSILYIKNGNWSSLGHYNCLLLKSSKKGLRRYSGRTTASIDTYDRFYEVWICNSVKRAVRKRLLLSKSKEETIEFAHVWSKKLNLTLKTMNDLVKSKHKSV